MSTIIATTEVAPFQKEMSDGEEDWGIVKASDPGQGLAPTSKESVNTGVEAKPKDRIGDDIEFIQILDPDRKEGIAESDSSSTCSFDVIDENKKAVLDNVEDPDRHEEEGDGDDVDGDEDGGDEDGDGDGNEHVNGTEFHFDFPTMVALFCLTTVLGFVIGHGKQISKNFESVLKTELNNVWLIIDSCLVLFLILVSGLLNFTVYLLLRTQHRDLVRYESFCCPHYLYRQQCWAMLLTTVKNVASNTLFKRNSNMFFSVHTGRPLPKKKTNGVRSDHYFVLSLVHLPFEQYISIPLVYLKQADVPKWSY